MSEPEPLLLTHGVPGPTPEQWAAATSGDMDITDTDIRFVRGEDGNWMMAPEVPDTESGRA